MSWPSLYLLLERGSNQTDPPDGQQGVRLGLAGPWFVGPGPALNLSHSPESLTEACGAPNDDRLGAALWALALGHKAAAPPRHSHSFVLLAIGSRFTGSSSDRTR